MMRMVQRKAVLTASELGYGFGGAEEMWNAGAVAVYEDQKALREALV